MKTFFATLLIASLAFTSLHAQGTVKVIYDGPTASVIIPDDVKGVTYTVSGAHVVINSTTITQEYTYSLSGASDNGSLTFNGNYKFTMSLDGLQLTNAKGGAAIDVECGKRPQTFQAAIFSASFWASINPVSFLPSHMPSRIWAIRAFTFSMGFSTRRS